MASERGQATVEWTGTTLLVALAFVALIASVPAMGGSSLGRVLEERIVCAVTGGACGVRKAQRAGPGIAATSVRARTAGLFDDPWVPGFNWKGGVSKSRATVVAWRLRDANVPIGLLESALSRRLPKKLVTLLIAASGVQLEQWAREVDLANDRTPSGGQVCLHFGGRIRNPPLSGNLTYPDLTAWPRRGSRC